jgi:pyruvate ferredoxin oxidoreductase gamma subunit
MKFNKNTFEIIFFARAGQGAKTAAEILAQAATNEGKYIQAFPYFGPERSGAPTKTYVRISDKPIRTHEPIIDPDVVVVLDDTLLEAEEVTKNLDENESLIINTVKDENEIRKTIKDFSGNIKAIDGDRISIDILGQARPNSVLLGKLIQVTEVVKLESLKDQFRKIFEKKIGKELTEKNIAVLQKGYDGI